MEQGEPGRHVQGLGNASCTTCLAQEGGFKMVREEG